MEYDFVFRSRRSNIITRHGMVAASQPLAALAGLDILRAGGTAADAAIAVAAALNVVEPFSTGIGGDCFALYWDAKTKKVYALNSSGPAARRSSIQDLRDAGYTEYPLWSGQAVSVPGTVAGWEALLTRFGRMSLGDVLQSAIAQAENGYPVTEWIAHGWSLMPSRLLRGPSPKEENLALHMRRSGPSQPSGGEFLINGRAPIAGEIMHLPTLAKTLRRIAENGSIIYSGAIKTALGLTVWNHVLRTLRSYEASILGASTIIWTTLLAMTILGETLSINQWLGMGTMVVGLLLVQVRRGRLDKIFKRKTRELVTPELKVIEEPTPSKQEIS